MCVCVCGVGWGVMYLPKVGIAIVVKRFPAASAQLPI